MIVSELVWKKNTIPYIKQACIMLCELSFSASIYAVKALQQHTSKKHSKQIPLGLTHAPVEWDAATCLKHQILQKTNGIETGDSFSLLFIPDAWAFVTFAGCHGPQKFVQLQESHIAEQQNMQIFPSTLNIPLAPQIVFQLRAKANIPMGQAFCNGKLITYENNPITQEMFTVSFSLQELFHANTTGHKLFYTFKTIEDGLVYCFSLRLHQNVSVSSLFHHNVTQLETIILNACPEKYAKSIRLNNGRLFVGRDIPQKLNKLRQQRQTDLVECMRQLSGDDESVMEWKLKWSRICVGDSMLELDMMQINQVRHDYDKLTQNNSACLLIFVLGSLLMDLAQMSGAEISLIDIDACVNSIRNAMPKILQDSNLTNIYDNHVRREMMCNVRYTSDGNWQVDNARWLASKQAGECQSFESGMCLFNRLQSFLGASPYETFDDCETLHANFGFLETSLFLMNSQEEFEILMLNCLQNLHIAFPSSSDAVTQYQKLASEIMTLGVAVYEQKSQKMRTKMQPETHTHEEIHQKITDFFVLQEKYPTRNLHNFICEHPHVEESTNLSSLLAASAKYDDVADAKADSKITDIDLTFPEYTENWTSLMESSNANGNSRQGHACGLKFCQLNFAKYLVNQRLFNIAVAAFTGISEPTSLANECPQYVTKLTFNGQQLNELECIMKKRVGKLKLNYASSLNFACMSIANRAKLELAKSPQHSISIFASTQNWELPTQYPEVCQFSFYKTAIQSGSSFCFTASNNVKDNRKRIWPGIALDRQIKNSMPLTVSAEAEEEEKILLLLLAHFRAAFAIQYQEMSNSPKLSLLTQRVKLQSRDGLLFALDAEDALNSRRIKSFTYHAPTEILIEDMTKKINELFSRSSVSRLWNQNSAFVQCF